MCGFPTLVNCVGGLEKGKKEKKENRRRDMYAVAYNAPTKNQALRDSFTDFFLIRSILFDAQSYDISVASDPLQLFKAN